MENKWLVRLKARYAICASYPKRMSGNGLLAFYHEITPNSEGSERVQRVLSEISGMWELQKIPLSKIPWSDTSVAGKKSQVLINKYVKMGGEMPPIILDEPSIGEYEIVDGFHRIAAAKKRGDSFIRAYIPTGED